MNQVVLSGRVIGEPRSFDKENSVNKFAVVKLATIKAGYINQQGQAVPARELYHRICTFNKRAEFAMSLHSGDYIIVTGEVNYSQRQDEYGSTTQTTEIFATNIEKVTNNVVNTAENV